MSFAAVCIIVACLILMGSFLLIAYNISNMITNYEQKNVMIAYVDEELSETEAQSLGSKINLIDNVMYAEYVTKEQALDTFVSKYEGNELMKELEKISGVKIPAPVVDIEKREVLHNNLCEREKIKDFVRAQLNK